jgi:hypothetical protein
MRFLETMNPMQTGEFLVRTFPLYPISSLDTVMLLNLQMNADHEFFAGPSIPEITIIPADQSSVLVPGQIEYQNSEQSSLHWSKSSSGAASDSQSLRDGPSDAWNPYIFLYGNAQDRSSNTRPPSSPGVNPLLEEDPAYLILTSPARGSQTNPHDSGNPRDHKHHLQAERIKWGKELRLMGRRTQQMECELEDERAVSARLERQLDQALARNAELEALILALQKKIDGG